MLRNPKTFDFEKYYEPRAVAIGPFHHGNQRCELAEEFKPMLTKRFLDYTEQKDEDAHQKVKEKIKELRECYAEEATQRYDDETLAWMLFLDGCSTLQFIHSFVVEKLEELSMKRDQIAFAQQDLFLLENQVPYQVLKLLMSSSNKRWELKDSIETYVQANIGAPGKKQSKKPEQKQSDVAILMEKEPAHLLDLLRTKMLGAQKNSDNQDKDHSVQSFLTHLLHYLRSTMVGQPRGRLRSVTNRSSESFRSVEEHRKAGINFRLSERPSLTDVYFKYKGCRGFLYLPKIQVDNSTWLQFMNMIAYELCTDFQNDYEVTAYIGFLSSLIDHPDDVKHLRKRGILLNLLGSDEEVAQLFKEMDNYLVPNNAIYGDVEAEIEKYHNSNWKKLMAFIYDNSTWLASISVLLGLGLSGFQT